ncbi:hypothetical protein B9Z55_003609 [Caenorhabditis nigoni]|uniref:Uncharacterized protein n=1 Tax=Caenorhabditis nigoni TaxID=1611254 RepID=A0A2G5VRB1_9PELO|nr:hypothetical protein B9Z55_003609 [Caenorhabditis nigoni]
MWNRDREGQPDFRFPEVRKPSEEIENRPEKPVQRSQGVPHILKKPRTSAPAARHLAPTKTKGTSGLLQGQPLLPSYRKGFKAKKSFSAAIPYPPKWLKNVCDLPGASSCNQPSQSVKELNWQLGTPQEGHQGPFQPPKHHKASQQSSFVNNQSQLSGSIPGSQMSCQQISIESIQPRSSAPTYQHRPIGTCPPRSPVKTTQSKLRAKPRTLPRSDAAIAQCTEVQSAATIVQKAMNAYNPSDLAQCQQRSLHGYETSHDLNQSMGNLNLAPNQNPRLYWGLSHQSEGPRYQYPGQQIQNQLGISSNQHSQDQASICQKLGQQLYSNPGTSSSHYFPVVPTYHQDPYCQLQHLQSLQGFFDGCQDLYNQFQGIPFDPYHRIHSATGSFSSSSDEFQDYGIEDPTTLIDGSRKRVFSRGTSSLSMTSSSSQPPPKKPKRIRNRGKVKVQESSVELQPMKFENGLNSESMKRWLEENVKPAVLEAEIRKRDLANKVARIDSKKFTKL